MKKKLKARVLSALISASMVLNCIPAYAIPNIEGTGNQTQSQKIDLDEVNQYEVATSDNASSDGEGGFGLFRMINDRFTVDGVTYKEIGPGLAQLFDASGVSGDFTVPKTVTSNVTDEEYIVVTVHPNAFSNNKALTQIVIDDVFENVEGNLFSGCSNLKSAIIIADDLETIDVIEGITEIGNGWFENSGISDIEINGSILSIGERAFADCDALVEIELPYAVENIGDYAFASCDNLEYLNGGENLINIGKAAFQDCVELQYPALATNIGAYAYAGCTNMQYLQFDERVHSIGDYAFAASGIDSLNIGNDADPKMIAVQENEDETITKIHLGKGVFSWCENLQDIYYSDEEAFSDWFTEIGDYMYYNCPNISYIGIPEGVERIGKYAYALDDEVSAPSEGDDSSYYPPNVSFPQTLKEIDDYAFYQREFNGVSLYFSETSVLERIGVSAFDLTTGVISFVYGGSVECLTIDDYAFQNSLDLCSIEVTNAPVSIGFSAFLHCDALEEAILPKLQYVGDYAFWNNTEEVVKTLYFMIPVITDENSIGIDCFMYDSKDVYITIDLLVEETGGSEAKVCAELLVERNHFKENQYDIYEYNYTTGVREELEDGSTQGGNLVWNDIRVGDPIEVDEFPNHMFAVININPNEIAYVGKMREQLALSDENTSYQLFPNTVVYKYGDEKSEWTVTSIGLEEMENNAEYESVLKHGLEGSITISKDITYIYPKAFAGTSITEVIFDEDNPLTVIEEGMFENCDKLTKVVLPEGLETIEPNAFKGCSSLASITIPVGVTSISDSAFEGCSNLAKVIFEGEIISIGDRAFYGTASTKMEIPASVKEIGTQAFDSCKKLKNVHICGDALERLGANAFDSRATVSAESGAVQLLLVEMSDFKKGVLPDTTWNGENNLEPGAVVTLKGDQITAGRIGRNAYVYIPSGSKVVIPNNLELERDSVIYVMEGAELVLSSGVTITGKPINNIGEGSMYLYGSISGKGQIGNNVKVYVGLTENMVQCAESAVFSGKKVEPDVTVELGILVNGATQRYEMDDPDTEEIEGDFTCTYSNNLKVGTATVTITPTESGRLLSGQVTKTFEITKGTLDQSKFVVDPVVEGSTVTVEVTVNKLGRLSGGRDSVKIIATQQVDTTEGENAKTPNKLVKTLWLNDGSEKDGEVKTSVSYTWENVYNGTYDVEVVYSGDANHNPSEVIKTTFTVDGYTRPSYNGSTNDSTGGSGGGGNDSTGGGSGGGGNGGGSGGSGVQAPQKEQERVDYGVMTMDPVKGAVSSIYGVITSKLDKNRSEWVLDGAAALIWGGNPDNYWRLQYVDGSYAKGTKAVDANGNPYEDYLWEFIDGEWWAFDSNGLAKMGWIYDEKYKGWFYVHIKHGMQTGWICVGDKWYYLDPKKANCEGKMYEAQWTPDGYYVDESGAWDGRPQMLKAQ